MEYIFLATSVLIGTVFLVSLAAKTLRKRSWAEFVESVRGLAPRLPARTTAVTVALSETVVILLLLLPGTAVYGLIAAAVLLLSFSAALLASIRRGSQLSCGCFGRSTTPVSGVHVARNALLTAAAVSGIAASSGLPATELSWQGGGAAAAVGLLIAIMVILADDVAFLFRSR